MEVRATDTSSSDGYFIVSSNYHLTRYKVRREIVPSHGYDYVSIGYCYTLNMAKELQNSEAGTFIETFERK